MPPIVQVEHLTKQFKVLQRRNGSLGSIHNLISPEYRTVTAVNDVCFHLDEGELVAYLGPNGAGKSTTLKMLTGLLVPSSGTVCADGFVPWKNREAYVARIGAVFGQRTTLWWDLPVIDTFELLQPMYKIPIERYQKNLHLFTEMLDMESFINTPARSLSLGQRMRADLCAALLHEPRLVFLDEPTIGLDVVAKERIRQFIQAINREKGTTILLTTHDLSDVELLCDRAMILDHGRVLFDGRLVDLTGRFEKNRLLQVTFAEDYADISLPGIDLPNREGRRADYVFQASEGVIAGMIAELLSKYRVDDIEIRRPALENTIRRIYEENLLDPNRSEL
jgi:ABC-2 type transport system ATP-binding protein